MLEQAICDSEDYWAFGPGVSFKRSIEALANKNAEKLNVPTN